MDIDWTQLAAEVVGESAGAGADLARKLGFWGCLAALLALITGIAPGAAEAARSGSRRTRGETPLLLLGYRSQWDFGLLHQNTCLAAASRFGVSQRRVRNNDSTDQSLCTVLSTISTTPLRGTTVPVCHMNGVGKSLNMNRGDRI